MVLNTHALNVRPHFLGGGLAIRGGVPLPIRSMRMVYDVFVSTNISHQKPTIHVAKYTIPMDLTVDGSEILFPPGM